MDLKYLEGLEKEYFLDIRDVLKDNLDLVEDRLTFLNKNKQYWQEPQKLDNAIAIGVQEIVRCILFRNFKEWVPFFLPVCSDTSFESKDAIINIDIKTVKNIDNDAKKGYLQIRPNQISYPNKPINGVPWIPHQPLIIKNNKGNELPTLSFFVKFIWKRKEDNEIDITEIVLCSVPNGLLAEEYGKDFIINYKTYDYDMLKGIEDTKKLGKIKEEWSSSRINFIKSKDEKVWGKPKKETKKHGKKWHPVINGGTVRFNIKKIAEPKLTSGWKRLEILKDYSI